jgi:uridine kinase
MPTPSFVIGIAGGTGAGKTTVAREIAESVGEAVTRIPLDNYYHDRSDVPMHEREDINYDHPDAFEWSLLVDHLDALLDGQAIEMPQYDFTVHNRRDDTVTVTPSDVIVVEGILALYDDRVTDRLDLNVYVETDADVRILRRIRRDVLERDRDLDDVIDQYLDTVKPMHEQFVAPTKQTADVIIPEGANQTAISLLTEKAAAEHRDVATDLIDDDPIDHDTVDETADADRTTVTPSSDDDAN